MTEMKEWIHGKCLSEQHVNMHLLFSTVRLACYWLCTDGPLCNGVCGAITVCNWEIVCMCV